MAEQIVGGVESLRRAVEEASAPQGVPEIPPPAWEEPYPGAFEELTGLYNLAQNALSVVQSAQERTAYATSKDPLDAVWELGAQLGSLDPSSGTSDWAGQKTEILEQERVFADQAVQLYNKLTWKAQVINLAPMYMSIPERNIRSGEDLIKNIEKLKPVGFTLNATDIQWLNNLYDKMAPKYSNLYPEGDILDTQSKILEELTAPTRLQIRGLHQMSVDEIARSFREGLLPSVPAGMSEQDVRNILAEMGIEDEGLQTAEQYAEDLASEWRTNALKMEEVRLGLISAQIPDLSTAETFKLLAISPMMASIESLDKYWDVTARPIAAYLNINLPSPAALAMDFGALGALGGAGAGAVIGAFGGPIGAAAGAGIGGLLGIVGGAIYGAVAGNPFQEGLTNAYIQAQKDGFTGWGAYTKAFNDWDGAWWEKMILETAFDPANVVGWGAGMAIGKKLTTAVLPRGLKQLAYPIGKVMYSLEAGYLNAMDTVFELGKEGLLVPIKTAFLVTGGGYQIPKTVTQISREFARSGVLKAKGVIDTLYPEVKNLRSLTPDKFREAMYACIDAAVMRPREGGDRMVQAGVYALSHKYYDAEKISTLAKDFIKFDAKMDAGRLTKVNQLLDELFYFGDNPRQISAKMLTELGLTPDDIAKAGVLDSFTDKLLNEKSNLITAAKNQFKGDNAGNMIWNYYQNLHDIHHFNFMSPVTTYAEQAGKSISWHSRWADRILYAPLVVGLENRVVLPVAKWNLLFVNFGPMNFFENIWRGLTGHAGQALPNGYTERVTNMKFRELTNDYWAYALRERQSAQESVVHLQSLVNPKTGETTVFKGGKIPVVTARVKIPSYLPDWMGGGREVSKSIRLWGKDMRLGSLQDLYNIWGEITMRQARFNQDIYFTRTLAEKYPEEFTALFKTCDNSRNLLDKVRYLSKREANELHQMFKDVAIGYPEYIRQMGQLDVSMLKLNKILSDFRKVSSNMHDASPLVISVIEDNITTGEIFQGGTEGIRLGIENARVMQREQDVISLMPQTAMLKQNADEAIAAAPRNLDELYGEINNIVAIIEATQQRIPHYVQVSALRKQGIRPEYRDAYELATSQMLGDFMQAAETEITRLIDNVIWRAKGSPLRWTDITIDPKITKAGLDIHLKEMFDSLPVNIQYKLNKINVLEPRIDDYAYYASADSSINFYGLSRIRPEVFYHEMSHAHLTNMFEAGGTSAQDAAHFLSDFAYYARLEDARLPIPQLEDPDTGKVFDITNDVLRSIGFVADDTASYNLFKEIHETHAEMFAQWMLQPERFKRIRPYFTQFFEDRYPRAGMMMPQNQIDQLENMLGIEKEVIMSHLKTRQELAVLRSEIPEFRRANLALRNKNPKKAIKEADAFWRDQEARAAQIWNRDHAETSALRQAELYSRYSFLDAIGKPIPVPLAVPDVSGGITVDALARMSGETGDNIYRMLTNIQSQTVIAPLEDFQNYWRLQVNRYIDQNISQLPAGTTADSLGFTREALEDCYNQMWRSLGLDPAKLTVDTPAMLQIDEMEKELLKLHMSTKISDEDAIAWNHYCETMYNDVMGLPMYQAPTAEWKAAQTGPAKVPTTVTNRSEWVAAKESALNDSKVLHYQAYPTYGRDNMLDETAKAIFPFWNYEIFRWQWLPRSFMRQPGTFSGLARYMNYTDGGYIPLPGTDLQLNPLRGTIYMGGLRSLYLQDFPEFHDQLPGVEFLDYIGRMGFFPGIHVMGSVALLGGTSGRAELAELTPSFIRTGLSALRQIAPVNITKILDRIYPDRFRDYNTMLALGKMGYDADAIWRKKQQGVELSPEEWDIWLKASKEVDGTAGILMQQTGLFRYRPPEFTQIRNEMRAAIEEATGVPVAMQERIDKLYPITGKRFSDYFHLDIYQQSLLYSWEAYRRYQGVTTPLYPSSMQNMEIQITEYYEALQKAYDDARFYGVWEGGKQTAPSITDINQQLVDGDITPSQWRTLRGDIQAGLASYAKYLHQYNYPDVPITFEERQARYAELGIVLPAATPDQELMWMYFETQPEWGVDPDTGVTGYNFDKYYAYIDILLQSLTPEYRERFLARVQKNWTPMEKLYWEFSKEYAAPYRNLGNIVLREFDSDSQDIIRQYRHSSGPERQELRNAVDSQGNKVIAAYESLLQEAHTKLRVLSPETDAWLNFFGYVTTFKTKEAERIYKDLESKYLTQTMVGGV